MNGWAGKIVVVDLSNKKVETIETEQYAELLVGGLGIAQMLYWELASGFSNAFHPDNPLIMMTGPLAATPAPSAPRLLVCGKSPCIYPETFVSANMGGFFAPQLKKAGFDGIVLTGKSESPVYICVTDGSVEIRDASHLWGMQNSRVRNALHKEAGERFSIISIGPGGEHGSRLGVLFSDAGSAASMGFGSVMGSKHVKAIAVYGSGRITVADSQRIGDIRKRFKKMTGEGYFNLFGNPILLPGVEVVKKTLCHGCPQGCWRSLQRHTNGTEDVRKCQLNMFYSMWDRRLHGEITEASFRAASLANEYGLCVMDLVFVLMWLDRCVAEGILSQQDVDLPMEQIGSLAFIDDFLSKVSRKQGFGAVLSEGALRASETVGGKAREMTRAMLTQTGRAVAYGPKVFMPSSIIYATEPRPFITELHEVCEPLVKWALWYTSQGEKSYVSTNVLRKIAAEFWGGEKAVDFSTYDGKARAAALIQNRQFMKEAMNLCDFAWPVYDDASSPDHVGDPRLEQQLFSAVTGKEMTDEGFSNTAERLVTLNRAILLREGRKGRQDDILPDFFFIERDEMIADVFGMHNPELLLPGSGDEVISRKGKAVDRNQFETMKDEYYAIRGWDRQSGIPTRETLLRLGLGMVADKQSL